MSDPNLCVTLGAEEHEEWDRFVAGHPSGTLFHTAWWHAAWRDRPEIVVRKDAQGGIVSGIAYTRGRFLGASALRRPPLTPVNCPLVRCDAGAAPSVHRSAARKETAALLCSLPSVGLYDVSFHAIRPDPMPYLANGFALDTGLTYVIPCADRLTWRERMSSGRRSALRKAHAEAASNGVRVETNLAMEDAAGFFADTARVKGYSASSYAHALPRWWREVRAREAGRLYGLLNGRGETLGVTALVWDGRTAYYLGGGMKRDLRDSSRLNSLLFEKMIADAHDRGLDFDFECSRIPGVERFFREWGGELRLTYRAIKIRSAAVYAVWMTQRYFARHRPRMRAM